MRRGFYRQAVKARKRSGPTRYPRWIMGYQQQRQEQRRAKLEEVRRQVENGSLVIRQMTEAERARYPIRDRRPKKRP
jgi:hypothetical protein